MERHLNICSESEAEFESRFVHPRVGRTLIAGSRVYEGREDRRTRFARAEGWDMLEGPGVDRVVDLEQELPPGTEGEFDHIECSSLLEHCRRPWLVAANLERLLRVGGTLQVAVPFVWRVHGYPDDYWRFTIGGVKALFPRIEWSAIAYASAKLLEGPVLPSIHDAFGYPFMARTQVCAFGALQ